MRQYLFSVPPLLPIPHQSLSFLGCNSRLNLHNTLPQFSVLALELVAALLGLDHVKQRSGWQVYGNDT
jgi:hypothetical protein